MKKKCELCNNLFKADRKERKFCSRQCSYKSRKKNLIKVECVQCGNRIERYPSTILDNVFCSKKCHLQHKKDNHSIDVNCDICGEKLSIKKYKYGIQKNFYCSTECRYKGISKNQSKENHPMYNPSITDEERKNKRRIEDYEKWRTSVFEKDNYICQYCIDDTGGNLNAHHLNGYHWSEDGRTDVKNGVTLCDYCHKKFHMLYGYKNNTKEQFQEWIENK